MNLLQAIRNRDMEGIKVLLRETPGRINEMCDGAWPAFEIALTGSCEMVKYLVEYTMFSLNHKDSNCNNLLHFAVRSGDLQTVQYLVERGNMSPTSGNWDRVTPYDLAKSCGHTEILKYFEEVCGAAIDDMYHNPVVTGMSPDPSVIRVGEYFYMVNSSFIFFPCIPISRSKDLVSWEVIGHAITEPEYAKELNGLEGGRGYWAPDISFYEGRFYITATLRRNDSEYPYRRQMITVSDKPEGPYGKPIFLEEDGIDPSLFTDVDGRRYMLLNRGARIFELNRDCTEIISEPRLLWYGGQKRAPEAPHLLYKDGFYYLFIAEGGTGRGHRIAVARSKELFGPYEECPYNPIMRQWDEDAPIQCCGHGKPVQLADGRWYILYLCSRMIDGKYGILGRETCLDPIRWTNDGWPDAGVPESGWPVVNELNGPSMLQKKPFPEIKPDIPNNHVRFPEANFFGCWQSPRVIEKNRFRNEGDYFVFKGDGEDLNSTKSRSVLVQSQPDFRCTFECTVNPNGLNPEEDAGVTCYYDENSYFKLGAAKTEHGLRVFVKEYIDDRYIEESARYEDIGKSQEHQFRVSIDHLDYKCFYKTKPSDEWKCLNTLENAVYLSSEGLKKGKRFTGAKIGIYVNGNSEVSFKDFIIPLN